MDRFTHRGLPFTMRIEPDDGMGKPWKEHDGHGVVTEWVHRDKAPNERILARDRNSILCYDVSASIERALKEEWGLSSEELAKLGENPTKRQVAARAVDLDFERLRKWCNGEWCWTVLIVALDGRPDIFEVVGGIESDSGESYFLEMAKDLANELIRNLEERIGTEQSRVEFLRELLGKAEKNN